MLTQETITNLKGFGFDTDALIKAVTDEAEVAFAMPEGVTVLKAEELTSRDANTKAEGESEGFKKGKVAGLEIAGKAIVKKFNLENVDAKDPDKVAEALNNSVAKGDTGLKEQVALLQKDKERLEVEAQTAIKESKALAFDTELIKHFPANRSTDLSDGERLMLLKHSLKFEEVDGVQVVKKDGNVLRNPTTKDPLPVKDAITSHFAERKWVSTETKGRGGNDNTGTTSAGMKKFSDVEKAWKESNPDGNIVSPEFQTFVADAAKATTDFDWSA